MKWYKSEKKTRNNYPRPGPRQSSGPADNSQTIRTLLSTRKKTSGRAKGELEKSQKFKDDRMKVLKSYVGKDSNGKMAIVCYGNEVEMVAPRLGGTGQSYGWHPRCYNGRACEENKDEAVSNNGLELFLVVDTYDVRKKKCTFGQPVCLDPSRHRAPGKYCLKRSDLPQSDENIVFLINEKDEIEARRILRATRRRGSRQNRTVEDMAETITWELDPQVNKPRGFKVKGMHPGLFELLKE